MKCLRCLLFIFLINGFGLTGEAKQVYCMSFEEGTKVLGEAREFINSVPLQYDDWKSSKEVRKEIVQKIDGLLPSLWKANSCTDHGKRKIAKTFLRLGEIRTCAMVRCRR